MGCEQSFPNKNASIDICDFSVFSDGGSYEFCVTQEDAEEIHVFFDNSLKTETPLVFYIIKKGQSRKLIHPNSENEINLIQLLNNWLSKNYSKDKVLEIEAKLKSGKINLITEKDMAALAIKDLPEIMTERKQ